MSYPKVVTTPDGAKLAYDVLGSQFVGHTEPIVLVNGLTGTRGDWERLSSILSKIRPVLIYDHRGIGDSTLASPDNDSEITMEVLARDVLFLISALRWKEVAICGFSMGGVITQQLLLLPYIPLNPTALPFRVTHTLLTGTNPTVIRGMQLPEPPKGKLTPEQMKEFTRPMVACTLDPVWLGDEKNKPRWEWLHDRSVYRRPLRTIIMQKAALQQFDFADLHAKLPMDNKFLIIHGKADALVPFHNGEELLKRISTAHAVGVGNKAGEVPNLNFGHLWWEYFDIEVWRDVIEVFLNHDNNERPHDMQSML